jgi:hypothetical protein
MSLLTPDAVALPPPLPPAGGPVAALAADRFAGAAELLGQQGWCVLDGALPAPLITALATEARTPPVPAGGLIWSTWNACGGRSTAP